MKARSSGSVRETLLHLGSAVRNAEDDVPTGSCWLIRDTVEMLGCNLLLDTAEGVT